MHSDKLEQLEKRKVVVFGGNGFIGSHFVDQLVHWGHTVTVYDRFTKGKDNCAHHPADKVTKVTGDYTDPDSVSGVLKGADIVYNFISPFNPITSWNKPVESVLMNVLPDMQLCELCIDHDVQKLVYLSSGGTIYGPRVGLTDEKVLPNPFNPHGICKLTVEYFLNYYRVKNGLMSDVYRVGNVFGPRQPLDSAQGVIAVWMKRILSGEPIDVYGDRHTLRDYIYVKDATRLLGHSLADLTDSDVFTLGTGKGVSVIDLLEIFKEVIDMPFESHIHPRRVSDNTSSVLSSEKILRFYPDFAFRDLKDMIRHTWEHVRREFSNDGR